MSSISIEIPSPIVMLVGKMYIWMQSKQDTYHIINQTNKF